MIQQLLQRYEQESTAGAAHWERFDNDFEHAYIHGMQQGAQVIENSLQEALDSAAEGGDLALALDDLAATLVTRATAEKLAMNDAVETPSKLGYIKVLERGAHEIQGAAHDEWRNEAGESA